MNINCNRDIFLIKKDHCKTEGITWKGCSASMPGSFGEQVEGMNWVSP